MKKYRCENWTMEDIANAMKGSDSQGRKIIIPIFQRGKRWSQDKKEKFIESLLKGYPVGTLLFAEKGDKTYSVVDGLQRSSTACEYILSPTLKQNLQDVDYNILDECRLVFFPNSENITINRDLNKNILDFISKHSSYDEIEVGDIAEDLYIRMVGKNNENYWQITKKLKEILKPWFVGYKQEFESIKQTEIPVIVYTGNYGYLNDIFRRINKQGEDLTDYEIYAAIWDLTQYVINNTEIIEAVIKKYDSLALDNYTIEEYDSNEIRRNKKLTAFEFLFGFGKTLIKRYGFLNLEKAKRDDEVSEIGFELVDACINNSKDIENLANTIRDRRINLNLLERRINEAIKFVGDTLAPICTFRGNSRGKIQYLHPKYLILSLIAFTFREMYDINDMNEKRNDWDGKKSKTRKNLLAHYIFGIVRNDWHDGGIGKMYTAVKERAFAEEYGRVQWDILLNGYFEDELFNKQVKKFSNPTNADKLLLNCIYTDIFTVMDNCSDVYYDIEHLATKKRMEKLIHDSNCTGGLPVSHIANLCYLPAGINRGKKDKTIYEDVSINMPIEELEKKFSFTKKSDFEYLDLPYESGDYSCLENEFIAFLKNRFKIQKEKIYQSLRIE